MSNKQRLAVYVIREYTNSEGKPDSWWSRIGTAFVNKDGSLNVELDAVPVNGKLHIREEQKRDDSNQRGGDGGRSYGGGGGR